MTRISASASNPLFAAARTTPQVATPAEALRRLNLRGEAGRSWEDVLQLDAPAIASVARTLDEEREAIEKAYAGGTRAAEALIRIDELLTEAGKLAKDSAKRGAGRHTRGDNQKKIDALLSDVQATAADATLDGAKLLNGRATLTAGRSSLRRETFRLDRIALATLGRLTIDGRSVSLADVARRGELDMTDGRASVLDGARRSLDAAKESVNAMRERITTFQRESLRPRLGDVATAMEGLFTRSSLGGSEEATLAARQLRQMMVDSATIATATAADGWNRERALALLT